MNVQKELLDLDESLRLAQQAARRLFAAGIGGSTIDWCYTQLCVLLRKVGTLANAATLADLTEK